jgi:hypothetical protein
MVGGQPSSYAIAAAEQAQNAHNAAMSDIIPQLRDAAYAMYADEGNAMRNDLNMLLALDEMEYGRHQDAYANQMAKWQADYGVGRDMVEDERYEREFNLAQQSGSGRDSGGDDTSSIVSHMLSLGDDVAAYEYLVNQGLSTSIVNKLWEFYETEKEKVETGPTGPGTVNDTGTAGDPEALAMQIRDMFGSDLDPEAIEALMRSWGYGADVIDATFGRLGL